MGPSDRAALTRFTHRLGYTFRDSGLLSQALTHRSAAAPSNERLEFLGDGVLNFVAGLLLYERQPGAAEGDLSYRRASLVREEALARVAEELRLGEVLILGPGERKSGAARRASILADALEAVLGAVFLDGGFEEARRVCTQLLGDAARRAQYAAQIKDAKTRLQEYLQGRGRPPPAYDVRTTAGPPHRQAFTVCCRLEDGVTAEGHGSSRKAAEQDAARQMIDRIAEAGHA